MSLRDCYLDLLMRSVLGELYVENEARIAYLRACVEGRETFDPECLLHIDASVHRRLGRDGRLKDDRLENLGFTHTMIGRLRLENVTHCLEFVLRDGVPGDAIECGVWRGGTALYMAGFFAAHGQTARRVWLADSFEGPPAPSLPQDADEDLSRAQYPALAVPAAEVRLLFERYGLLSDQVLFLPGWFRDTLRAAPIERLSLLRIDADLYESTLQALDALYSKVQPGGFVIVDDYGAIPACRAAVDDFRSRAAISEVLEPIDWTGVYWRRSIGATRRGS